MHAYLITHGKRAEGFNPLHTEEGLEQIANLSIPADVTRVVVGSGRRFHEIAAMLYRSLAHLPLDVSPFCGGCEGIRFAKNPREGDMIILSHGEVLAEKYLGLIGTPGFDPWAFVVGLGAGVLLCAGGELLLALGFKGAPIKGALFGLDTETKQIALLQEG